MNPITPWLVCVALLVTLVGVVYVGIKTLKAKSDEVKRLTDELEKQRQNMAYLVKHAEEIAKIESDEDSVQEEIRNAKTDEEVVDIINAIINVNNARVCK